jgi:hypothetical protein
VAGNVLLIAVAHAETRRRFASALERTPHHLVFALSAEDCRERFREVRPDLVVVAPGGGFSGPELMTHLREHPGGAATPLVHVSRDAAPALADAELAPDFERRELLAALAPLLAFGRAAVEDPPSSASPELEVASSARLEAGASSLPEPEAPEDEAPGLDAQTVVGFPSPFIEFEGSGSGPREEPTPVGRAAGTETSAVIVQPSLGEAHPPTPVGARPGEASERSTEVRERSRGEEEAGRVEAPAEQPSRSEGAAKVDEEEEGAEPEARAARRGLDESQLGQRLAQRVERLHASLDDIDYYQLLGVEASADESRIHAAWFDLSLELHPDRFFLLRDATLKEKIYEVHRRVTEAHRVLADPARRSEYDRARSSTAAKRAEEGLRATHESPPLKDALRLTAGHPSARVFADRAEAAFGRDDLQGARFHLHAILACEAENQSARRALALVEARLGPTA